MSDGDIERLIHDKYFDIYTRNGFEYIMQYLYTKCKFYLIDFDDIRGLNESIGYCKVNDKMKMVFSELKKDYTIGRAFSGDEIFFQTYRLDDDISKIKDVCNKYNLTFKHIERMYDNDCTLEVFLEKMIKEFH